MDEHTWATCCDAGEMLAALPYPLRAQDRKDRLLAAAYARRAWLATTPGPLFLGLIEASEHVADGRIPRDGREAALIALNKAPEEGDYLAFDAALSGPHRAASSALAFAAKRGLGGRGIAMEML